MKIFRKGETILQSYRNSINIQLYWFSAYYLPGAMPTCKDIKGRVKVGNRKGLIWLEHRVREGVTWLWSVQSCWVTWRTLHFMAGSLYFILVTVRSHWRPLRRGVFCALESSFQDAGVERTWHLTAKLGDFANVLGHVKVELWTEHIAEREKGESISWELGYLLPQRTI